MAKIKFIIRYIVLATLMPLSISTTWAQSRTRIFGIVKDEKGSPVELATVRVTGQSALTFTNLKGEYSLLCNSADSVRVVYSMIGYETRKRLLRSPADSIRIDIMLPFFMKKGTLGTAEVVGQGVQTGTVQRISKPDMKLSPSTTGNGVEEIIATQAGVSTHNELSSQYNVRGGSFDENCVYLNGIEVYRPMLVRSGQQEGLSIINSDMVESIGFSSGGFEARYGDKMSSVLDITYKHPEQFEATAQASALGAGTYIGWGNKKVSLMTSVRYKTTKYLLGSTDTNGEYQPNFLDYQELSCHGDLIADGRLNYSVIFQTTITTSSPKTEKPNSVLSVMPKALKFTSMEKKRITFARYLAQQRLHAILIRKHSLLCNFHPLQLESRRPMTFKVNIG